MPSIRYIPKTQFLKEALKFEEGTNSEILTRSKVVTRLDLLNKERKARFVSGCIQNINVLLMLCDDFKEHEDINFLSTQNCARIIWNNFLAKFEANQNFQPHMISSLVHSPKTGNSEVIENDVDATPNLQHQSFVHGFRVVCIKMLIYSFFSQCHCLKMLIRYFENFFIFYF